MTEEVSIDLVQGFAQTARFFRDGNKDYVEISFIGNPDTVIQKVTPAIMAQYRDSWNAFCDGVPMRKREGTALTELSEITQEKAVDLIRRNVHNLEELAALTDHQCQGLGHGTMSLRKLAQALVGRRQFEKRDADHKKINESIAPAQNNHPEMAALSEIVKQQGEALEKMSAVIAQLNAALQDKPARKKRNGPKLDIGHSEPGV